MSFWSPREQKARIAHCLAGHDTCVISTTRTQGIGAVPVRCHTDSKLSSGEDLAVDCLVPRWTDVAHYLANRERTVALIMQMPSNEGLRWLQIRGMARRLAVPDWGRLLPDRAAALLPESAYVVVRVIPQRIDLVDESLGWGIQETVEW